MSVFWWVTLFVLGYIALFAFFTALFISFDKEELENQHYDFEA